MKLNLIGAQEKGLSVDINNQESLNCHVMASPRSRNGVVQVGSPGTRKFSQIPGAGRGGIRSGGVAYFVKGTTLYSVDINGAKTTLGTIPGTNRVGITTDGTSVIIVNGTTTGYFYNTSTSTLSTVTLPYAAHTVAMLDTYAIFSSDGERWFISNVGNTDSIDALDFASANKSPDDLLAVIEDHSEIFLFGTETIEPFFNSADVDFPFAQNTAGVIERGLYARHAIFKDDNTIFFLGDDLIVYRLQGYTPIRISDDSTEIQLANLRESGYESDLRNAFIFTYTDHGHKFIQLTIPNRLTLVFDLATNEWHKKQLFGYNTHHADAYVFCYGKHLISGMNGNIYHMSRNYYDDDGTVLKRGRTSHVYSDEDRLIHWKRIKFIFEFGTTSLLTGQGSSPVVMVDWSDDGGRTFKNIKNLTLGRQGDYNAKAIKRNCGASRARIIRYYVTDPVPFILVDAYASLR